MMNRTISKIEDNNFKDHRVYNMRVVVLSTISLLGDILLYLYLELIGIKPMIFVPECYRIKHCI